MSSLWTPSGEHRVPREPVEPAGGGAAPPVREGPPPTGGGAGGNRAEAGGAGGSRAEAGGAGGSRAGVGRGSGSDLGPQTEVELGQADLRRLTEELAAASAETVVANHCYGLFELAALHLSLEPPQLEKARLAIDALGLLVDGLRDRLGPHSPDLVEGLNQLRLAYVRVADPARRPARGPVAPTAGSVGAPDDAAAATREGSASKEG